MNEKEKKEISKFLSLVLRHQPEVIGIYMDENGWVSVEDLIKKCKSKNIHFDREGLNEIVSTNDKQRFAFSSDRSRIRANQGHSINIDLALEPQQPPATLYHGTADKNISSILTHGITKVSRQHVHLSTSIETSMVVGARHGKPSILCVDAASMHNDGYTFYQSENKVWLTDVVPFQYISIDGQK
jgi:putative RNA 2'-phosphotransferase